MNQLMTSGIGAAHTNEPDHLKPNKVLTPYLTIGFDAIKGMVDNPQEIPKPLSQWLIPSTLPSRTFKAQEANGSYLMLWVDIDGDAKAKPPVPAPSLFELADIIEEITGGVAALFVVLLVACALYGAVSLLGGVLI